MELESRVMAAVKAAAERGDPPLAPASEIARFARDYEIELPSPELGLILVSNLCFANNTPFFWKLLDHAVSSGLLSPLYTLAVLTRRVIPNRRAQPEAYRLYLELLNRYIFASPAMGFGSCRERITKSIDDVLQLSSTYVVRKMDFGHVVILFLLSVIMHLIDATLEDWGLQLPFSDKNGSICPIEGDKVVAMDVDKNTIIRRNEKLERLHRNNALSAIEVVEKITANKKAKTLLRLTYLNMPEKFNHLLQRFQFIEIQQSTSESLISANAILVRLFANIQNAAGGECQFDKHQLTGVLLDIGSCYSISRHGSGPSRSSCWIPIDIFMENAMDGKHLHTVSAIEILTELTKTLQAINQATWQETFQALWVSALRLVQRDRDPLEGPIPHLDARLCMLLCIVPLAIIHIVKKVDEISCVMNGDMSFNSTAGCGHDMGENVYASRIQGLISSLQLLGQFSGLLLPPSTVVIEANMAASKAATFIFNIKKGNGNVGGDSASVRAVGNMLHLIVEACIARKLLDTSAYFWPGYLSSSTPSTDSILLQETPWSSFMKGAPLTSSLRNALTMTPASSIVELEKLYHIALSGSEEEKSAAARILCGASLTRGWNIQEHVVHSVINLLSPPAPPDCSKTGSHLVGFRSMLHSVLLGLSCVDVVHILSLYGMIPKVAAALMPLCETFGSLSTSCDRQSSTSDESSPLSVFSCAFLFLLRLWKFYRPPLEQCKSGRGGTVMQLTLNYLLLIHNSRIALHNSTVVGSTVKFADSFDASSGQPVYIDSFPKLRAWYIQNEACIASTISGLSSKNPVHQIANRILNMICQKMVKAGTTSDNPSSASGSTNSSPMNADANAYQRPMLPAWEVLEAVPFVLEALLTACAHGKLSSRDLTTGLRDLVDFLPASLVTIISYFSAEITRGIWKPVMMNGIDWPSPAANLLSFESEIKEVLESVGVHLPSCYACKTEPVMVPLPMAALVSLTITFKLDKSLEYIHGVAGQALENTAIACSWPSMPVIGALWSQKVRRWHDFIVLSCARSPFTQNKEAVAQLIRSCFSSFLGSFPPMHSHPMANQGVSGLLGQAFAYRGVRLPVPPGFLYLRSCRTFHDTHFVSDVILRQVVERAHDPVNSAAAAAERVKEAATLGASLLCNAGGLQLVQLLYAETLPMFLLSGRRERKEVGGALHNACVLEGYGMAYTMILAGALVWGVGAASPMWTSVFSSKRAQVIGAHGDFMAGTVEGKLSVGCDPGTWRAYVSCFVSLMVRFVPSWVAEVKLETLERLSRKLRGWGKGDLALELLERGGPAAVESVVDSLF